jgi:radical S-adenosyl methionine domain-containing protein 2
LKDLEIIGSKKYILQYYYSKTIEESLKFYGFYPKKQRQLITEEYVFLQYIPTINFHLIQPCNMECNHCFSEFEILKVKTCPFDQAEEIVNQIASVKSMKKLNFSGGEPTIYPRIEDLIIQAKKHGLETSLVTNGYEIIKHDFQFLDKIMGYLDILAISIDSFEEERNDIIGRKVNGNIISKDQYIQLANEAIKRGIRIKINTVVTKLNFNEQMADVIISMKPIRWKIFKMLLLEDENSKAIELFPNKSDYNEFLKLNKEEVEKEGITVVSEDNEDMTGSYLMISPDGRFFNNVEGKHIYSEPIIKVGIEEALYQTPISREKFYLRDGCY